MSEEEKKTTSNFIREIIDIDLESNKHDGKVITRFPPEPNGYLHIGHAKSICLNFGIAKDYRGRCHLRFDDTNPEKEEVEYIESIKEDIKWLGFDWDTHEYYASDYFQKMYDYAEQLILMGKAYVCNLSPQEMKEFRGTLTEPGKPSPGRERSIEENLYLLRKMKNGEFEEGAYILRAKIDMASPNLNMRDPAIYRIKKVPHHRTGSIWKIYPMYDYAHCLSDSIEGITHSICTLEFEAHRPLYDWFLDELKVSCHPQQIEFARLNINYTVMSKRKLLKLVKEKYVSGWDDPRLPTISGLRRRGYTPESIRNFAERVGVAKANSVVDVDLLEYCIREDMNKRAPRVMAVLRPLKVIIDNYPDNQTEWLDAINNPEDPLFGSRKVPFSKVLYIELEDFMENPPKKFYRLSPGNEVRLRYAYFIRCTEVKKNEKGEILEIHCTYDPATKGGSSPDNRQVKATMHWVSAPNSIPAEVRLYDRLFKNPAPDTEAEGKDFTSNLNPNSLEVLTCCRLEPSLKGYKPGNFCQFERQGYFCIDSKDSSKNYLVFNRIVTLKDTWAKLQKKGETN